MVVSGKRLSLSEIESVAYEGERLEVDPTAFERMAASRAVIEKIVAEGKTVYGVNTGFGKLSSVRVPDDEILALQVNLVRSHACGVGRHLSEPEVRAMLLLRANVLALGFSGARPVVAEKLVSLLNAGVHPVVPEQGSVGASGDLAPLAHLALAVIGEGQCDYKGSRVASSEALADAGIEPLKLHAKEGLALLNGTQAMMAIGGLALARCLRLLEIADASGAMTLEALLGTPVPFDPRIHDARPFSGQRATAKHLMSFMEGSEIRTSHLEGDERVQDAYSLRCMPQVHGAARDAVSHVVSLVETETGSATDNPLVFENGDVLSGGNFHGAPLALGFDYAAIAMTDLASIAERRIDRMVTPEMSEGLPAFLTSNPGTGSGYMIAHVAAVSLLNECKVLSHPASVDNLPTSGGKEDHVSMGTYAALKLRHIVENVEAILAIELMAAAEGLEYRKPLKPGPRLQGIYEKVRKIVPHLESDRPLSEDIERLSTAIRERRLTVE
ncbi:MAG TPA: histidine ammonia-lyase [Fimbriimonadaceae bacterium]|nr:histidine ammonia-lyase [Fimbriimonadaceae bacterium]